MKRFTIGVTTHNEEKSIRHMLDLLARIPPEEADIILYDDRSTDRTKEIVLGHGISKQANFHAHFSEENYGSPSAGRAYAGQHATTEYVVLFDGDDIIDVEEFRRFAEKAPSGQDIILSSYQYNGRRIGLIGPGGPISMTSLTASRIIAGIGGKAYRTELLREFGPDPVRGRSDDVRLNMRLVLSGVKRIYHVAGICFYLIEESRKSTKVATINFHEVITRIRNFEKLREMYPIDNDYLLSLKGQLERIVRNDPLLDEVAKQRYRAIINAVFVGYQPAPVRSPSRKRTLKGIIRNRFPLVVPIVRRGKRMAIQAAYALNLKQAGRLPG